MSIARSRLRARRLYIARGRHLVTEGVAAPARNVWADRLLNAAAA